MANPVLMRPATVHLWTSGEIEEVLRSPKRGRELPPWAGRVYAECRTKLLDPRFPCYFGTNAFNRGTLRFEFAASPSCPGALRQVSESLREYLSIVRGRTDEEALLTVFILFFKPEDEVLSLEAYHRQAWGILQFLHDHDAAPWPLDVPKDPDDSMWSFCYDSVPIFVNINSPAHCARQSRNLTSGLTLVLQPREAFDIVAGRTPKGEQIRKVIRERLQNYDGVGPAPELGNYGTPGSLEWRQYGLTDDNGPSPSQCPMKMKKEASMPDARARLGQSLRP